MKPFIDEMIPNSLRRCKSPFRVPSISIFDGLAGVTGLEPATPWQADILVINEALPS
jgi:hypothetical protein